jgi:alkanesulfonate monooxygenase SsuD/methylene tetrahydromethanopterin reductase-like flavin-dependent oxidoreductase (luciferase family)
VELVANFMTVDVDPSAWARTREAEGWDVLSVADHLWSPRRPYPHLWVTLAAVAAATERVKLTSAFANNLFRSPVEFAQASLALHALSGGRFEAGLGAGWSRDELERTGREFPPPGERVSRYVEALQIVRALFHHGSCQFTGRYYRAEVERIGPTRVPPPLLVGSVGGPRMIREAVPFLDRVELKAASQGTREGELDLAALGQISRRHLLDLVAAVRDQNPDVPLGMFVICSVGSDNATRAMSAEFPKDSLYGDFFGEPAKVADAIRSLSDFGITRAQISPFDNSAFELLAPELQRAR